MEKSEDFKGNEKNDELRLVGACFLTRARVFPSSPHLRVQSSGDTGPSVINRRLQIPDANTPPNTGKLFHN